MQAPENPKNEQERLASLVSMKILDTPIEDRFDRVTRLARRSFGVPISAISLIDADRQWFKSIQGLAVQETSREVSFCGHAILGDGLFVVPDSHADDRFRDNPLVAGDPNIRFYAGCPVHNPDGHKVGTLCLIDNKPRDFDADDEVVLRDLARMVEDEFRLSFAARSQDQLVAELDRARLAASVDPLTRIWNRGAIMEILKRELAKGARGGVGVGLLMIDFDHFKKINDTHGHLAGDAVLREGVARMLGIVRTADAVGRYGGEEFMAVLADCHESDVEIVGERLRAAIEQNPMTGSGKLLTVSASVGGAWCPGSMLMEPEGLIALADAAVYKAKAKGRNRVEMSRYID